MFLVNPTWLSNLELEPAMRCQRRRDDFLQGLISRYPRVTGAGLRALGADFGRSSARISHDRPGWSARQAFSHLEYGQASSRRSVDLPGLSPVGARRLHRFTCLCSSELGFSGAKTLSGKTLY